MSKPHKWAKEIKAWADGAEIQFRDVPKDDWKDCGKFGIGSPTWNEHKEYRIKPQPKEPQYLYAYFNDTTKAIELDNKEIDLKHCIYIGKIKLEQDE